MIPIIETNEPVRNSETTSSQQHGANRPCARQVRDQDHDNTAPDIPDGVNFHQGEEELVVEGGGGGSVAEDRDGIVAVQKRVESECEEDDPYC